MKSGLSFLMFGLVLFSGGSAHATASSDGIEAAAKLCQDMGFSNEVTKCNQLVTSATHFDVAAVEVCKSFSFSNKKMPCLETIKNKTFVPTLLNSCKGMSFDDKILSCLAVSGKAHEQEVPEKEEGSPSQRKIRRALRQLDKGNYGKVRELLKELLQDSK